MERCAVYKFVDEIDHYLIKCPDKKVDDADKAKRMIYKYTCVDETVEKAFSLSPDKLACATPEKLFDILVKIRETLLSEVL